MTSTLRTPAWWDATRPVPDLRTALPNSIGPATPTSPKMRTMVIRIANWLLASIVRSSADQPRHTTPIDSRAIPTARRTKAIKITASLSGWSVERQRVTRRIGPNSPTAPAPSR